MRGLHTFSITHSLVPLFHIVLKTYSSNNLPNHFVVLITYTFIYSSTHSLAYTSWLDLLPSLCTNVLIRSLMYLFTPLRFEKSSTVPSFKNFRKLNFERFKKMNFWKLKFKKENWVGYRGSCWIVFGIVRVHVFYKTNFLLRTADTQRLTLDMRLNNICPVNQWESKRCCLLSSDWSCCCCL